MKLRLCCLSLALCAFSAPAFADIAPPPIPMPTQTPQKARRASSLPAARMSIESRNDAREARLQIPQNVLRQLRAEMERDSDAAAGAAYSSRPAQTIIAGVLLSLSLAFAGVLVARTRSRNAKQAAVALVVLAATGALAFRALANARPPEPRALDAGSLKLATTPDVELNGLIRVEIVPEDGALKLIVPAAADAATRNR